MVWESVRGDVRFLSESKDGQLIQRPLWLTDVREDPRFAANFPGWVRGPFEAFDMSPAVTHGPWGVWLAWYRAILPDTRSTGPQSGFGRDVDLEIATKETEFWERDPDLVVADIAEIAKRPWREKAISSRATSKAPRKSKVSSTPSKKKRSSRASSTASDEPTAPLQPGTVPEQPKAPQLESVEPQSDEPTSDDQLGRRPFAQALVERMDKIYRRAVKTASPPTSMRPGVQARHRCC
jgi:hypothetical protein